VFDSTAGDRGAGLVVVRVLHRAGVTPLDVFLEDRRAECWNSLAGSIQEGVLRVVAVARFLDDGLPVVSREDEHVPHAIAEAPDRQAGLAVERDLDRVVVFGFNGEDTDRSSLSSLFGVPTAAVGVGLSSRDHLGPVPGEAELVRRLPGEG